MTSHEFKHAISDIGKISGTVLIEEGTVDNDGVSCFIQFEDHKSGYLYTKKFTRKQVCEIHRIFNFDAELLLDVLRMCPTLISVKHPFAHVAYVFVVGSRSYYINIRLPHQHVEESGSATSAEMRVMSRRIKTLEDELHRMRVREKRVDTLLSFVGESILHDGIQYTTQGADSTAKIAAAIACGAKHTPNYKHFTLNIYPAPPCVGTALAVATANAATHFANCKIMIDNGIGLCYISRYEGKTSYSVPRIVRGESFTPQLMAVLKYMLKSPAWNALPSEAKTAFRKQTVQDLRAYDHENDVLELVDECARWCDSQ
jgi:hypothetical protein